jgi:hypothetical protein
VEPARRATGRLELEEIEFVVEEELWADEDARDHAGWYCVRTDPFPCPASGCAFVADFMTAAHLILVWENRDDPNLLRHANRAKEVGRNPRVTEYERSFGPSASYYAWEAAGRPVHGIRAE